MGVSEALLDQKLGDLERARSWSPRLVAKLEALINDPNPWKLYRINPRKFAAERNVDESEALDLFLHGVKGGLFNLEWQLLCPSCGDTVKSFDNLTNLRSRCFCSLCHLESQVQLDDFIQVSFSLSESIRFLPWHRPLSMAFDDYMFRYRLHPDALTGEGITEVENIQRSNVVRTWLKPGEELEWNFRAQEGAWAGHDVLSGTGFFLPVDGKETWEPQELTVEFTGEECLTATETLRPGPVHLRARNRSNQQGSFVLLGLPPEAPHMVLTFPVMFTGNRLLNSQTYRNLFRSETIGTSEGIGVRDLTLVFTDLKGSTALYERIGDLKAFSLVQQHFDHLGRAVQSEGGAIVKTIGDAVMASFDSPLRAARAALKMRQEIEAFNQAHGDEEMILKIGLHRGASIAVTLNERLDFFGQSVNIAARVQGVAKADEICLTRDVWEVPGVEELFQDLSVKKQEVRVKGIQKTLPIYRVAGAKAALKRS